MKIQEISSTIKRKQFTVNIFGMTKKFTAYSDKNKFFNEVEKEFNISGNVVKKYLSKAEIKYNLTEKIFLNKSLHKLSTYLNTDD